MSSNRPELSARERAELLIQLEDKKIIINNSSYDDKDVRKAVFSNCRSFIMSGILSLNILSATEEDRIDASLYPTLYGISKEGAVVFFNSFGKFIRLSLVTMFQFQIENCLKNILFKLTTKKVPKGFYPIADELLKKITIKDPQNKMNILYVPAMIRNTLHSGGIHTEPTKIVIIDGERFEFRQGDNVFCATWYHIHKSFDASIDVLQEIITSSEVSRITDRINDQYIP